MAEETEEKVVPIQIHKDFMEHYHKRSNAESTVQMIKSKFGDFVRSKTWTAQVNEVLCKIICHNICVNIQEMYELGIEPDFHIENNPLNFNKHIDITNVVD